MVNPQLPAATRRWPIG